jgi:hypothetical protein
VDPLPAHCCRSRPPQNAAELPVEAATRASRIILLYRLKRRSLDLADHLEQVHNIYKSICETAYENRELTHSLLGFQ